MADDNNSRYRSSDPYGRPSAAGQPGSDPLAELARLIGQNDPFGEAGRDSRPPAQQQPSYGSHPHHAEHAPQPAWPNAPAPVPQPTYDPFAPPAQQTTEQHYAGQPYPNQQYGGPHGPVQVQDPAYGTNSYHHDGHTADPHGQPGEPYHAPYEASPSDQHGAHGAPQVGAEAQNFQPLPPYLRDGGHAQSEDFYDDAPQGGRRKGLITVIAVLCLAVIGTAGAFAYRSFFAGPGSSGPPPVIRASGEPSKVAPPPANPDPSASKLTYDRFGDRSQNEQVVSREEQPMDPRDIARTGSPRVIFPGAPNVNAGAGASAMAPSPPAGNAPSALGEPKRVRTVPIRPDQPDTAAVKQPPAPAPAPAAPQRQAVAAAAPASAPLEVAPQPAPSFPPPPVAARAAAPRAAAVPSGNAPLSLNPDSAPPAAAPAPRAAAPARVAAAPAGNGGGYLVQVSSQRSEADAQSSFRSIQSKYSTVLGDRQAVIRRADLGEKGTYYRAMIGPFSTREQAVQLCGSLKAAGGDCVVQAN